MIKNKQLVCDNKKGDCFRACMTSILGIPNDPKLPNIDDKGSWYLAWKKFLYPLGLDLIFEHRAYWRREYWIASVQSKNFANTSHAIVMCGDKVAFDPSTKKRYRTGRNLLSEDIVKGGYYLEAIDPSKLHKLKEYKDGQK